MCQLSRANVIITDLPELVPLMNMNIEENITHVFVSKRVGFCEQESGFFAIKI